MSMHRWSLPSRAFTREKSKDSDPGYRTRFPTIHIGDRITRRRSNISAAFANLFEKDENRLSIEETNDTRTRNDQRPFSCIENLAPSTRSILAGRDGDKLSHIDRAALSLLGAIPQVSPEQRASLEEALQEHIISNPFDDQEHVKPSGGSTSDNNDSPTSLERTRSTSSSYPSEGIRSPPDHSHSPPMNPWTEDFIAEISRYGKYPSGTPPSKCSTSTNDALVPSSKAGKCLMEELAAAGGISDTDTRTASRVHTPKPPLSDVASTCCPPERPSKISRACRDSDHFSTAKQEIRDVVQRDILPALDGQVSSTSAIYGGSYPEIPSSRTSSSEEEFPCRSSHTGSRDCLRQSTETCPTHVPRKIHWGAQSHVYNTMPAAIGRDAHRRSRIPRFSPPLEKHKTASASMESNGSSATLVQRIHKFKFRKWIKKHQDDYKIKVKSEKAHWSALKTSRKLRKYTKEEEEEEEGKGMTHRLMNSIRPKYSVQVPLRESYKEDKKRAQSCPP
ncbi:hypothetical protein F5Y11DRAFT_356053 [Daldinia sp. FL1419]|nr:hypothetical protein F5Y11DRAFT_356053 [Daldinia sp. FL1419]